jgi:hypothetical protein
MFPRLGLLATPCAVLGAVILASALPAQTPAPAPRPSPPGLAPFVANHCVDCHDADSKKGGLDLTSQAGDEVANLWRWHRIRQRLVAGDMPPPGHEPPPRAERDTLVESLSAELRREVPKLAPDPGRSTVRRLSRTHYENTVRDLFGVEVTTTGLPVDDLGYGFDTVGDAMTFSTLHLEAYLALAQTVAAAVFDGEDPSRPTVRRFEAEGMPVVAGPGVNQDGDIANLYTNATLAQDVSLPRDGEYRLRVRAGADQAGEEPAKCVLRRDGEELTVFEVEERRPREFELRVALPGGRQTFELAFVNDHWDPEAKDATRRDRNLRLDWLQIEGPCDVRPVPPARQWLLAAMPQQGEPLGRLRALAKALLPRVWRRPVADAEVSRLARAAADQVDTAGRWLEGPRFLLAAALASPHFLFRLEPAVRGKAGGSAAVPAPALAVRLSYFVHGSTPDEPLRELARTGKLLEPAVFAAELDRLLAAPAAGALATDFAAQWLELKSLADRTPDPMRFPGFDDALRRSLRSQTELLVQTVLRDDLDVRDLLDAPFTHIDARLAALYGMPAPADDGFTRVALTPELRLRGGVLGHGSVLAVTSNPTRTSPVKRGKWILENLLGQAPPPPPPGNDSLANEAAVDSTRSFREQLAQHGERAACAGCHVRMDALGFALERFDAIGRYREQDAGGAIDCSGQLPDGTELRGLPDLVAVVRADPAFVHTVAHKLFVYANGRDLRPVDRLRLEHRVDQALAAGRVTLRDLVRLVATDEAFVRTLVDAGSR